MPWPKNRDSADILTGFVIALAILSASFCTIKLIRIAVGIDQLSLTPRVVATLLVASATVCLLWLGCVGVAYAWGRRRRG